MMATPPPKRRLSAEQRRALAMLATAGRNGVTGATMSGKGFRIRTLARLVHERLATARIGERVTDGKTIEVIRFRITAAGRKTLKK